MGLPITDNDADDLKETAIPIAEALNLNLSNKYKDFFETLTKTYYKYFLYSKIVSEKIKIFMEIEFFII